MHELLEDIKLNTINILGKDHPIYCDMRVLEQIQENYDGTLYEFERDLIGIYSRTNKETGEKEETLGEPKIRAVSLALETMLMEGYRINNLLHADTEIQPEQITEALMIACNISPAGLSSALHDEFLRCFEDVKKKQSKPTKKTTKAKTLTSSTSNK